jgi:hypothetical protein
VDELKDCAEGRDELEISRIHSIVELKRNRWFQSNVNALALVHFTKETPKGRY